MIQDNTTKWKVRKLTDFASNQALPVGFMYQHLSSTVPLGSLPLFGGEYDRTLYADLWSWANENGLVVSEVEWQSMATAQGGSCSKFSDGNGSTTFRVPALKCWIKGATGVEEVGSYLEAGLPAHTHEVSIAFRYGADPSTGNKTAAWDMGDRSNSTVSTVITSNPSNSLYGNSDTVQPPSIVGMWLIVAYGTVSNVGNVDLGNAMQKVEKVLRSFSSDGHLVLPDGSEFWIA